MMILVVRSSPLFPYAFCILVDTCVCICICALLDFATAEKNEMEEFDFFTLDVLVTCFHM